MISAASSLGYRPSRVARALVTGVSDVVVIVLPQLALGPRVEDAVELVSQEAAELGKSVFVRIAGPDPLATIATLVDLRPAAVIDFGGLDISLRERVPAAGITLIPRFVDVATALDPNRLIGRTQAMELLRHGHRRLAYGLISDGHSDPNVARRAEGVKEIALERGIEAPLEVSIPLNAASARAALESLITRQPVGIACYNDDVAHAVLAAARSARWTVPDEIAVVGADATKVGQLVSPRLTSVTADLRPLLHELLQGLREALLGVSEDSEPISLADSIIVLSGETT